MTRWRCGWHLWAYLTVTAVGVAAIAQGCSSESPPATNVLFIVVDDLRPELGVYGQAAIRTPNIDRLAAEGVLFERAYSQQAVCAPSRAAVMSGLRTVTSGIDDQDSPVRSVLPQVVTMPQHFRQNGYETVSLGKVYHDEADDDGLGWSTPSWRPIPDARGAWRGRGYLTADAQALIDTGSVRGLGVGPAFEAADVGDSEYPDGATLERALQELRRLGRDGSPFFLAVGFSKPHLPFNSPKRYWDLYESARLPTPKVQRWPRGMPKLARRNWYELRKYVGMPRAREPVSPGKARVLVHGYFAAVSYVDALVGRLLAELRDLGLRDDTIVVLWGDHGYKLGEYSAWAKHTNLEIDTRVPLILSAPGFEPGTRSEALVELVDLYPTLTELCRLPVPEHLEGSSLVPLLEDPAREWKSAAFSQYPREEGMGHSIRAGRWRYTEWRRHDTDELVARELYDHGEGPLADRNTASDPAREETVERLSALLDRGQGWRGVRRALASAQLASRDSPAPADGPAAPGPSPGR